jgi:hypothetical protein
MTLDIERKKFQEEHDVDYPLGSESLLAHCAAPVFVNRLTLLTTLGPYTMCPASGGSQETLARKH